MVTAFTSSKQSPKTIVFFLHWHSWPFFFYKSMFINFCPLRAHGPCMGHNITTWSETGPRRAVFWCPLNSLPASDFSPWASPSIVKSILLPPGKLWPWLVALGKLVWFGEVWPNASCSLWRSYPWNTSLILVENLRRKMLSYMQSGSEMFVDRLLPREKWCRWQVTQVSGKRNCF